MYRRARGWSLRAVTGLAVAMLAACGGGGGGDDKPEEPEWTMDFAPGTLEATTYEGESVTVVFNGVGSVKASNVSIDVTSSDGVITSKSTSSENLDQRSFVFTVEVSPDLSPGTYSGLLDLRVCNGADCHDPRWPHWQLPYRFTVHPAANLTPLSKVVGVDAWQTYQGNAAHDGHVNASFAPSTFVRRFVTESGSVHGYNVAVENGLVFAIAQDNARHWWLKAMRESDGGMAWQKDLGTLSHVNPPAVAGGQVYVTSTGHDDSFFWAFDALTGSLKAKRTITSQWENYMAPTVFGGAVYTESGYYGGMSKFDTAAVAEQWTIGLDQFDRWSPAVDSHAVYAYVGTTLSVIDPVTGAVNFSVSDHGGLGMGSEMGAPVLDGQGHVFAVDSGSRLVAFSLADRNVPWSVAGERISSDIAVSNQLLYVVNGQKLEARSTATGAVRWSWQLPEDMTYNDLYPSRCQVVVANNLVFVSAIERTYAVDLSSHQKVWEYPEAGTLAVSDNGVLYIARRDGGKLSAINLH